MSVSDYLINDKNNFCYFISKILVKIYDHYLKYIYIYINRYINYTYKYLHIKYIKSKKMRKRNDDFNLLPIA